MSVKVVKSLALAGLAVAVAASVASAQVIDGTLPGHQLSNNTWTPDNNNDPFWDNISADGTQTATNCNVGFFALGTIDPSCQNAIPGTFASEAAILGNPYGYTTPGPNQFGFAPGAYDVSLLGGLHGSSSSLFTYACDFLGLGDASHCYIMDDLTSLGFNDGGVGTTLRLDYSALGAGWYWGLGYSNSFNTTLGCGGVGVYCTGINDGTSVPTPGRVPQFFALFESNNACSWGHYCYLVGAEDNNLEYMPNGAFHDSDYQDWLISVNQTPEPATMGLIATGLVGLTGAGLIRRRRTPKV